MANKMKYGLITDFIHSLIDMSYGESEEAIVAIDATAGNGHDSLFLAELENSYVYAFDIQKIACENTTALLEANAKTNFKVINDGHENIDKYVDEAVDIGVFNLGYLPTGDKSLHTHAKTSIEAIDAIIEKLSDDGKIYIAAYLGHDDCEEANAVYDHISLLDKKKFNVMQIRVINKSKKPPEIYIIEKK